MGPIKQYFLIMRIQCSVILWALQPSVAKDHGKTKISCIKEDGMHPEFIHYFYSVQLNIGHIIMDLNIFICHGVV